jgi:hypothetical protein
VKEGGRNTEREGAGSVSDVPKMEKKNRKDERKKKREKRKGNGIEEIKFMVKEVLLKTVENNKFFSKTPPPKNKKKYPHLVCCDVGRGHS